MSKDIIVDLINDLDRLTLTDIDHTSDEVLKVLNHMLLNWHVLMSQEEDKRALLAKQCEGVMSKLDVSGRTGQMIKNVRRHFAEGNAPTTAERKEREKPPLSPLDGRVARGKGKNQPLNFRVTPEFKQAWLEEAQARGITMTDLLEEAYAALKATGKGKR